MPLRRRLLFTTIPLLGTLVLVEVALRAAPLIFQAWRRATFDVEAGATTYVFTLGDSVTAGSGLQPGEAWPDQMGRKLRETGDFRTAVANVANSGERLVDMRVNQTPMLDRLPKGAGLVVTLLAHHNDFAAWPDVMGKLSLNANNGSKSSSGGLNLRLFNVVLWRLGEEPAHVAARDEARDWLAYELRYMDDQVRARGGVLYVLNYAMAGRLVGFPPDDPRVKTLEAKRESTLFLNALTFEVAEALGIQTIDLQGELDLPETWDDSIWRDEIHYTAKGSDLVAQHVLARLRKDGVLPEPGDAAAAAPEGGPGPAVYRPTVPVDRVAPPEPPVRTPPSALPPVSGPPQQWSPPPRR